MTSFVTIGTAAKWTTVSTLRIQFASESKQNHCLDLLATERDTLIYKSIKGKLLPSIFYFLIIHMSTMEGIDPLTPPLSPAPGPNHQRSVNHFPRYVSLLDFFFSNSMPVGSFDLKRISLDSKGLFQFLRVIRGQILRYGPELGQTYRQMFPDLRSRIEYFILERDLLVSILPNSYKSILRIIKRLEGPLADRFSRALTSLALISLSPDLRAASGLQYVESSRVLKAVTQQLVQHAFQMHKHPAVHLAHVSLLRHILFKVGGSHETAPQPMPHLQLRGSIVLQLIRNLILGAEVLQPCVLPQYFIPDSNISAQEFRDFHSIVPVSFRDSIRVTILILPGDPTVFHRDITSLPFPASSRISMRGSVTL